MCSSDRRDDRSSRGGNVSNEYNRRDRNYGRDRGGAHSSFTDNHYRQQNSSERRHRSNSRDRKERRRSRSRSRERTYKQPLSRMERDMNKVEQLKKMGIEWAGSSATVTNNLNCGSVNLCDPNDNKNQNAKGIHNFGGGSSKPLLSGQQPATSDTTLQADGTAPVMDLKNFTAPILVSARYTEQMQKRKLLWSNKKLGGTPETATVAADVKPPPPPTTTNKWEMTKFSQDSDGKVASKFLRLMGMKDAPKPIETNDNSSAPDVIKKQNEMFTTMEHQYEVARQVTHTMRGMGLGFGSQQRQF